MDEQEFERLKKYNWHEFRGMAVRWQGQRIYFLHRFVLDIAWDNNLVVSHKNGKILDNRKENLIIKTRSVQAQNRPADYYPNKTSEYKGVGFIPHMNKWRVRIQQNGKRQTIGFFTNEIDAAMAYNKIATKIYGRDATLNIL